MALYQLDARGETTTDIDLDDIRDSIETIDAFSDDQDGQRFFEGDRSIELAARDQRKALTLALAAWEDRAAADSMLTDIAPEWRPSRLAPIDRAILRLAHHELAAGKTPPRAAVSEAVELAKVFSTQKSRGFVNGVLRTMHDRIVPTTPQPAE